MSLWGSEHLKGDPDEPLSMRTVLIVDDHQMVADALACAMSGLPSVELVSTAPSAGAALALAAQLHPDVIIMDVQLGAEDGLVTTETLTKTLPEVRVVVLTGHPTTSVLERAMTAGACALIPKDGSLTELIDTLNVARREHFYVHPALVKSLVTDRPGTAASRHPQLTPREKEVLRGLADGHDATQIARSIGVSVHTCRGHIKSILGKLDAHTQLEAVIIATRRGLITVTPARHPPR